MVRHRRKTDNRHVAAFARFECDLNFAGSITARPLSRLFVVNLRRLTKHTMPFAGRLQ
jgi:hypothetical protein